VSSSSHQRQPSSTSDSGSTVITRLDHQSCYHLVALGWQRTTKTSKLETFSQSVGYEATNRKSFDYTRKSDPDG
jgi:hypothetical protein